MQTMIELPRQTRAAEVRAQSFDEAANTVDIVWTTGATVRRTSWFDGPYDEKLEVGTDNVRLDRLNAGAAFLNTHDAYDLCQVLGSIVPGSARMQGGQGVATVLLSRAAGAADIVQNIKDGVIRNISAGYIVHAVAKTERDDGSVPLWTVTDWEPVELSAVPVPADPGAQIRSGQAAVEIYPCRMTRADVAHNPEAAMADDTAPKPAPAGDKTPTSTQPTAAANTPPVPTAPATNPGMVQAEVAKPEPGKVPGQPAVIDPGDAHPLPLTPEEQERRIREGVARALGEERDRTNGITDLAARFGMRELGDQHVRAGTKIEPFRNLLIDKLAEERAADGGPKGTSAAPEPALDATRRNDRAAGEEMARRALNRPGRAAAH